MKKIDFIISVTTFKQRLIHECLYETLNYFKYELDKLFNIKYVICIYKKDIKYITESLYNIIDEDNVELFVCDIDYKSHNKYYYTMQKYKNIPIITIDDDVLYKTDFISNLYNKYLITNNKCIIANICKNIMWDKPYNEWKYNNDETADNILALGYGGILYSPNVLNINEKDVENIYKFLYADDLFLKDKENKLNLTIYNMHIKPYLFESVKNRNKTPNLCYLHKNDEMIPLIYRKK